MLARLPKDFSWPLKECVENGENLQDVYGLDRSRRKAIDDAVAFLNLDYRTLARAMIATLPPDADEPISEEWLLNIGFTLKGINGLSILLPPLNPKAAIAELFLEWPDDNSDVWPVCIVQGYPDDPKATDDHVTLTSVSMRTIHQLRALLAALGVAK